MNLLKTEKAFVLLASRSSVLPDNTEYFSYPHSQ